ncbi:MAG: TIGR02710 family CRISPR-associated CARF protein [Halothece sp. Uz-M2-17]|nr:TIGR02710 family CRISPR-associated CARF protein [Halothece sp. Uz-M2-17]
MSTVLIVTVGGTPQPIVTAIRTLQPDRAIFLCSTGSKGSLSQVTGEGTPCEIRRGTEVIDRLPNIPTQAGLGDKFERDRDVFPISEPDDLAECYHQASAAIQSLRKDAASLQIMADYTGGTKTMSVGLAMAGLDHQVTLYLTTGNRTNTIKVERGELTGQATIAPIIAQRTLEQLLPTALSQYDYSAAIGQLKRLLSAIALPPEQKRTLQEMYDCCMGLEAWDRFDHQTALDFLQRQMKRPEIQPLGVFLRRVLSSRSTIDETFNSPDRSKGHGYEIVQDLLLNAQRRAHQERYDDAIGRLYRALELLAQIRLLTGYEIKTGNVDVEKLPSSLQAKYEQKKSRDKIQLGLRNSYDLLSQFPDDPLGELYQQHSKYLLDALETRNNSLFAHGFEPIHAEKYESVSKVIIDFIETGISALIPSKFNKTLPQFPTSLNINSL